MRRVPRALPAAAPAAVASLLAVLLAVAGCSRRQEGGPGGFKMPPMPVEAATVEAAPLVERFTAVGTLEASEQVTVVAEIDGIVESLPFREGGALRRGDVIARLDAAARQAEYDRAAALREQARAAHERVKTVVEQKAGAPQDLDDAAAALKVAEANLAVAKTALDKTRVTAPFDGVAGARRVSPGAYVRAGDALTDLARLSELRVNFTMPERYLSRLGRGAAVTVATTAFPDMVLTGTLEVIEPVVDQQTRTVRVVARVANPDGRLRPGMSAAVGVVLSERPAALTVPSEAVFAQGDQAMVYVIQPDSTVAPAPITLGLRLPAVVEVLSGLQPGAQVVRAGHQKLFPGAKVVPIPAGGRPGGGPGGGPGAGPGGPGGHGGPGEPGATGGPGAAAADAAPAAGESR